MMSITPSEHIKKLDNIKDNIDDVVMCSWINECSNYGVHCYHCKWNAGLGIGNFLIKEEDGKKTLRYLQSD